jgi:hypothetical protein
VIAAFLVAGQRRDSHLLGRIVMHLAMEEMLRAQLPIDLEQTSQIVVARFKAVIREYQDALPADFLRWVQEADKLIAQVATACVKRLAAQLTTAAPASLILQRPEVLAFAQKAQELQRRLDERSEQEDVAMQLAAIKRHIEELTSQTAKLSSELKDSRKNETSIREQSLPPQAAPLDDELLEAMKLKVELLHQIARCQKTAGDRITGELLDDASPRGILQAAREKAKQERRNFYLRKAASSGHLVFWEEQGKRLDSNSKSVLCEQTERENLTLSRQYTQFHKRNLKLFGED